VKEFIAKGQRQKIIKGKKGKPDTQNVDNKTCPTGGSNNVTGGGRTDGPNRLGVTCNEAVIGATMARFLCVEGERKKWVVIKKTCVSQPQKKRGNTNMIL